MTCSWPATIFFPRVAGRSFRVANDPAGLAALVERLRPLAPALAALQVAGIPAAAVNPRQARDFAKGTGRLAKTDRIDAEALAHFAEAVRPGPRPTAAPEQRALDALLSRRGQLIEMRVMEADRLAACPDAAVRAGIQRHIAWLDSEAEDADRRLDAAVRASPAWRERDELLQSIPGIGPVVSRTLLASLPELGAAGWRPWPARRRTPTTAARCGAAGTSAAAGPTCAGRCTWPPCRRRGGTGR